MFTLPSVWKILISTIVFIIAAWYIRRHAGWAKFAHSLFYNRRMGRMSAYPTQLSS